MSRKEENMIRHIVAWNFKEGLTEAQNSENAAKIKSELEGLKAIITQVQQIEVKTDLTAGSNRNLMLNTLFATEEDLAAYQVHPAHKKVSEFVRSVTQDRVCLDFYE